jgi:uncharacterized membrane protein YdfJ with MMPL/SSD domain
VPDGDLHYLSGGGAGFFAPNPLVRMSDRAEVLVLVFVLAAALVIAPVAGVMGTAVHDARAQLYAEESQSRHPPP